MKLTSSKSSRSLTGNLFLSALLLCGAGCAATDGSGSNPFSAIGSAILNTAGVNVSASDLDMYYTAGGKLAKAARGFTEEQEYYLGRGVAATVFSKYRAVPNKPLTRYANLIALSLAIHSERPETFGGYHVAVLDTDEVNAISAPGGFIFLTKGLLRQIPNEDALAAVLAHEIGHIVLGHGVGAISESNVTSALTALGKNVAESQGGFVTQQLTSTFGDSVTDMTNTLLSKGYSRSQEYDADEFGALLLSKAGYNPQAMITMLHSLEKVPDASKSGGWYSTHPAPEKRISKVEDEIPPPGVAADTEKARVTRFSAAMKGVR